MDELMDYKNNVPNGIEDLTRYVLIGREHLVAMRAALRAADKIGVADEIRRLKLAEAQEISEVVLDAEARIGLLTLEMPKAERMRTDLCLHDSGVVQTKTQALKALGLTVKQVERFEKLALYPELVEQVKQEARNKDDIVSRASVLGKIKVWEIENKRGSIITVDAGQIEGLYDVLYADPPWRYEHGSARRRVENHYPSMDLQDIKDLDVPCAENAVLFLWATATLLPEALAVMSAWGFVYKSQMIWDKERTNIGYWTLGRHEVLLIGTRGKFRTPLPGVRVASVYREKRTQHSRKPDYFYQMIEKQFPDGKYLELFARRRYSEKWEVWGNQLYNSL